MLLVIDVGNTNIVFGSYEGDNLIGHWRIVTDKNKTSDEYGIVFEQIFKQASIDTKNIKGVIISSVVPPLTDVLIEMSGSYFTIEPLIVGTEIEESISVKFSNLKEMGADRVVNAVAGYEKLGGPLVIIDFGTAITVDLLSEAGEYLGGVIAPGIRISIDALFSKTAKLPKVDIIKPEKVISNTTIGQIQSGVVYGYIGLVDYITERMIDEIASSKDRVKVIATGGFSSLISGESKYIQEVDEFLTLEGLRLIYERRSK